MNEIITLSNEFLEFAVEVESDKLQCTFLDRKSGVRRGPVPLMALEIHDSRLRRSSRTVKYRIDEVRKLGNSIHASIGAGGTHISLGIWVEIKNGELAVRLAPDEIYERKPEVFRLFAVEALPGLLDVGSNGQMLLPINQGMLCSPAGKPALRDRFLIYMEQQRWELTPTLPVLAISEKSGGMIGLMTAGACDAECRVETDGKGHGSANFAFSLRRHWPDPVDFEIREFRIIPFPPGQDIVTAAAKRLRRHAIEDLGKKTLRQRRSESPELDYALDAMTMKLFYGIQDEGADRENKADRGGSVSYRDYMTFPEAAECLAKLKSAGVRKIMTQSVGWNTRGHDGLYPTRFPINERAGGECEFRKLLDFGRSLGYQMSVHDNFMMNIKASPDWDPEYVIQDIFGEPLVHGWWGGGVEYATWPLALPNRRLDEHMRRMKDLGVKGVYYVDYMMQPLEVNYHPKWHGPRGHHNRGMQMILGKCREYFGSGATEFATFPGAIAADYVTNSGNPWHLKCCDPDWPITHLFGPVVPVWALALHGLVALEGHPGTKWSGAMNVVLKGLHPRDEWSVRPGQHPVLDDRRISALAAIYGLCVERFGHLRCEEIMECNWLGDLQTSKFSDGTEVSADFKKEELFVNGEKIERPASLEALDNIRG